MIWNLVLVFNFHIWSFHKICGVSLLLIYLISLNAKPLEYNFSREKSSGLRRREGRARTEQEGERQPSSCMGGRGDPGNLCRTFSQALSAPFPSSELRNTLVPSPVWDMWEQTCSTKSVPLFHSLHNFEEYVGVSYQVLYPLPLWMLESFKTELFIFPPKPVFTLNLELSLPFSKTKIWKVLWYELGKTDFDIGYQQLAWVTNPFELFDSHAKNRDNCT